MRQMMAGLLLAAAVSAQVAPPAASPAAAQAETLPASLACSFTEGGTATWTAGAFKRSAAAPLAFDIAGIDLPGQKAGLKSGSARPAGELRIIRALNANHFLEVAGEGFLNLTTVYDRDARNGHYPAVHSRHFGLFGEAVVAQYTGICRAAP